MAVGDWVVPGAALALVVIVGIASVALDDIVLAILRPPGRARVSRWTRLRSKNSRESPVTSVPSEACASDLGCGRAARLSRETDIGPVDRPRSMPAIRY